MDRVTQRVEAIQRDNQDGSIRAAENVLREFKTLFGILDRQFSSACTPERMKLSDAKLAASRGVELSNHLVELLRSKH